MSDERFVRLVRKVGDEVNRPDEPRLDFLWGQIEGEVRASVERTGVADTVPSKYHIGRRWVRPAIAVASLAATLLLGVYIGRSSNAAAPTDATVATQDDNAPSGYNAVALRHLTQTQRFLASYGEQVAAGKIDADVTEWAYQLLATTQMLQVSTTAQHDAKLKELLGVLEMVLVQIAALDPKTQPEQREAEQKLVEQTLETTEVMQRLKSVLPPSVSNGSL